MNQYLLFILLLHTTIVFGQTNAEIYKFKEDIYKQMDMDTVAWKYQTGAAALSFSNHYQDVLLVWDRNGVRKPNVTKEDSLYFVKSEKVDARQYIIERSNDAQVVIINEAHHIPKHRVFTQSLLQGLYDNGYRYLGLEALFDQDINTRKFPVLESGHYTQEPEFGNFISEALRIGFTLFGYEASQGKNGKDREIEQAENIRKFVGNNRDGKVLIHCGYAHAFENDYPAWGKAMAGRLKDDMKTDPFTIDQTMFLERSDKENNHPYMSWAGNKAIVLVDESGKVFNGFNTAKQTDVVVIHPETEFINNRPGWSVKGKQQYTIPPAKIEQYESVLILAYRNDESGRGGIPADILEVSGRNSSKDLYLARGTYEIVIKDRDYNVVDRYKISVQ